MNQSSAAAAEIAAVQRKVLAAFQAGAVWESAHKEGATRIAWERDRFVVIETGESPARQELTDERAFLLLLWRRYGGPATQTGWRENSAAQLKAWKQILRRVQSPPRSAMPPQAGAPWRTRYLNLKLALGGVVLVLAAIGFGVTRLLTVRTIGAPFGASVRAGDAIATLIRTQEPYLPRLHRNPERDRFRIDLRLTPLARDGRARMIPLARSLEQNAFHPGTKILGPDGPLLWMLVPELKAVDLRTKRVLTERELRAANPELGEFWATARFHFDDRLHAMSPDRQRSYTIDPTTLRAQPEAAAPRMTWPGSTAEHEALQCLGGLVTATEWIGVLASTEREASFRVGSLLAQDHPLTRSTEPRSLHRVRVEPLGTRLRIAGIDALSDQTFPDGALIRSARGGGPIRLPTPDAVLVTHRIGSRLAPTVGLTRIGLDGRAAWAIDTGLRTLEQILPDAKTPVLVGSLPAPEGKVPEPVLVVLDAATGAAEIRSLRP